MRDLTISDVLKLLRRWWWVLVLCPLLAGAAAFAISSSMTRIYEADTTLLVDRSQAPGGGNYSDLQAAQKLAETYSRLATTRPILSQTVSRLGLAMTPEELGDLVEVSPVGDTQLLRISVTDPDPARAAAIANTLAQVFIEQTREQDLAAAGSSRDEIRRNIEDVKSQIDSTSARIAELQGRPDANSPTVQSELQQLQALLSQSQATYSSLLETQQRMELAAAQVGTQIRVAEEAVPPRDSVRPRPLLNTALAATLGLFIAAGLVLVVGYLDDTVKTSDDVRRATGKTALGQIPAIRSPHGVEAVAHPNSAATEAYRTLRTNLQFATVGKDARSLVVTSSRPGDGKTTSIVNLAAVLAQGGQRVILVDADLRKPQVHRHFAGLTTRTGLTNLLLGAADVNLTPLLRRTNIPGLRILPAGPLPPNPPDVLNSPRMQHVVERLEAEADIVLFDAPPMAVSDALILGGLVDGLVLVTLHGRTRMSDLTRAVQDLNQTGTPLIGVVVNRVSLGREDAYYAYYRSYYEADSKQRTGAAGRSGERSGARSSSGRGSSRATGPTGWLLANLPWRGSSDHASAPTSYSAPPAAVEAAHASGDAEPAPRPPGSNGLRTPPRSRSGMFVTLSDRKVSQQGRNGASPRADRQ